MKTQNRTRKGARKRYGVSAPYRATRPCTPDRPWPSGGWKPWRVSPAAAARSAELSTDISAAVLLLVVLDDLGGLAGRGGQRLRRVGLAQDRVVQCLVDHRERVADARRLRREVHVVDLLGELRLRGQGLELGALQHALARRDLAALRPLERALADPVDEVPRGFLLVLVGLVLPHDHELVGVGPDRVLRSDLRDRRHAPLQGLDR